MLNERIEKALNEQINAEMWSAYPKSFSKDKV